MVVTGMPTADTDASDTDTLSALAEITCTADGDWYCVGGRWRS